MTAKGLEISNLLHKLIMESPRQLITNNPSKEHSHWTVVMLKSGGYHFISVTNEAMHFKYVLD